MDEKIQASLRVTSCAIRSKTPEGGDILEVKASGDWFSPDPNSRAGTNYPISVHLSIYPGCAVIPFVGDNIKVTIERENDQS